MELTAATMDARYRQDNAEVRFLQVMVGLITLSVLLLSAAGISAMMSFAVTRRRREIGIRTALGASRTRVIASIFARSTGQLGVGALIGIGVAALLDRITRGDMLGGQTVPLLAFVAAIMLLSGLIATFGPARRALRIQPMDALREE
jgi:ABC-type antimicrobial peptide transport system permease subunit